MEAPECELCECEGKEGFYCQIGRETHLAATDAVTVKPLGRTAASRFPPLVHLYGHTCMSRPYPGLLR